MEDEWDEEPYVAPAAAEVSSYCGRECVQFDWYPTGCLDLDRF